MSETRLFRSYVLVHMAMPTSERPVGRTIREISSTAIKFMYARIRAWMDGETKACEDHRYEQRDATLPRAVTSAQTQQKVPQD